MKLVRLAHRSTSIWVLHLALPFQRATSPPKKKGVDWRDRLSDLLKGLEESLTSPGVNLPKYLSLSESGESFWSFREVIAVEDRIQAEVAHPGSRLIGRAQYGNVLPSLALESAMLVAPILPQWEEVHHTDSWQSVVVHHVRNSPL
jgi:hypothetical protein